MCINSLSCGLSDYSVFVSTDDHSEILFQDVVLCIDWTVYLFLLGAKGFCAG